MDAFDADVLIYAGVAGHPLGGRVRQLLSTEVGTSARIGSVLLLPEVLDKPMRDGGAGEVTTLVWLLSRLDLLPLDLVTGEVATFLAAGYGLRAADAVHLATAVVAGADRFVTNNRRDFPITISEIDITYPEALQDD